MGYLADELFQHLPGNMVKSAITPSFHRADCRNRAGVRPSIFFQANGQICFLLLEPPFLQDGNNRWFIQHNAFAANKNQVLAVPRWPDRWSNCLQLNSSMVKIPGKCSLWFWCQFLTARYIRAQLVFVFVEATQCDARIMQNILCRRCRRLSATDRCP